MSVLLRQLLADPELGLELMAGRAGLDRRGPIRWVHISEIPDPTPWLSGGEVLLTTGLGVKDDPALQRALVAGLDRRGCTAIGFGVGVWLDHVPEALIAEADARNLPLFTVPYAVPFIAVTKYVARRVFEAHHAGLRRALDLHRRVLAAVTAGGGLDEVLRVTVSSLEQATAVVFDPFGQVLARAGVPGQPPDSTALWRALPASRGRPTVVTVASRVATYAPIRVGDDVAATLVLVTADEPDEAQQLLIEQGMAAASVELSRGLSARKLRRTRVSELLQDAVDGRSSRQRLAHRLEQVGIAPTSAYHVLGIVPADDKSAAVLCALLEDTGAQRAQVAVGVVGGVVHAVVQPADAALGDALVGAARGRGLSPPRVGRSRMQPDVDGLVVALREAAAAAQQPGSGVLDVTDLGVAGLLAGIGGAVAAQAFVAQILGPILAHDGDDASLLETLRAYLRHGCRPGPAASELRVHRHTLSYRLERIRQLTGRDPRAGSHLLSYGLALELLDQQAPT